MGLGPSEKGRRRAAATVNFARVLKEVVWCLITEGGISYRRIKLSFGLDDDALDELRRELIGIKRLAADLDGERLVWRLTGAWRAPKPTPCCRGHSALRLPQRPPTLAADRDLPGAERRHLTVMFCDLADSTRLSAQIDPEDMGDVTRAYQENVSQAVRRFDGFIAKFMGDGVRTGLAILDALPALGAGIAHSNGTRFAARIGIASGLVVVGETIGEGAAHEQTVVGDTPNLAARLQALAGPRRHPDQRRHARSPRRHLRLRGARRTCAQRHRGAGPGLARRGLARGGRG